MRKIALLLSALFAIASVACAAGPGRDINPDTGEEFSRCPEGWLHIDSEVDIRNHAGDRIAGRHITITMQAQSLDPDYQGVMQVDAGLFGRAPVIREIVTPEDDDPVDNEPDPIMCVPPDKAVAIMFRVSTQDMKEAYEELDCGLYNRGVVVAGQPIEDAGLMVNQLAYDKVQAQLDDFIDKSHWWVAQCDWLYLPETATGGAPPLFPRPDGRGPGVD